MEGVTAYQQFGPVWAPARSPAPAPAGLTSRCAPPACALLPPATLWGSTATGRRRCRAVIGGRRSPSNSSRPLQRRYPALQWALPGAGTAPARTEPGAAATTQRPGERVSVEPTSHTNRRGERNQTRPSPVRSGRVAQFRSGHSWSLHPLISPVIQRVSDLPRRHVPSPCFPDRGARLANNQVVVLSARGYSKKLLLVLLLILGRNPNIVD